MPVMDQVRGEVSGSKNKLELLDSGFRLNDEPRKNSNFFKAVNFRLDNILISDVSGVSFNSSILTSWFDILEIGSPQTQAFQFMFPSIVSLQN